MKKRKLGIGIIGLGRILPRHLNDSIKKISQLELIAVCDIKKNLAKTIAKQEGVKAYTDYKDLVQNKRIDVVSVLTPNYLHYEMGNFIAKNGKHCIMEKPIAQNYKRASSLVKNFKKYNKKLFPVLQVRYNPAILIIKNCVEKKMLGKILTALLTVHWTRPQEYYNESDWKGNKDLDGGSLLTQAIHFIDSMQWILGKAKSVIGKTDTVGHNIEVEDIASAIIDLQTNVRVTFDFTVCTYPHNLEASLTILGTQGSIKIGGTSMNKIEIWEVKNVPTPDIPHGLSPNSYAGGMYIGSIPNHKLVYENAVNVLLSQSRNFIEAEQALESLRIIDAILESSKNKKEVFLK